MSVFLIGYMGSGKSTIGNGLSAIMNIPFFDLDSVIEQQTGFTIRNMFREKGEYFFRAEEENEVLGSLAKNNCIIALGGGAFINSKIRENIFKNAVSIWLDCDIKILNERLKFDKNRPLRLSLSGVFSDLPVPPFVVKEWRSLYFVCLATYFYIR